MGAGESSRLEDSELMVASRSGARARIDRLMMLGARVNARDRAGRTPLMLAAAGGHAGCAEQLINAWGAEVDAVQGQIDGVISDALDDGRITK